MNCETIMIILYGSCRWSLGESREVQPLWLIGEFSALLAMRLGKFPNKLRYFLEEIPPCVIGLPIEPTCELCSLRSLYQLYSLCRVCRTFRIAATLPVLAQPKLSIYFSLSVGGWRGGRFRFQRLLLHRAVGCKVFPINTLAAKREEDLSGNGIAA